MSATPILDGLARPPVVKRWILPQVLVGIVIGLGVVQRDRIGFHSTPGAVLGSFLAAFYASILVHEAGHALVALFTGLELRGFVVGPILIQKQARGIRLKFVFARAFSGGQTIVAPRSGEDLKRRFAWFAAGGPIATLLLLAVSMLAPRGITSGMFAGLNALLAISSIVPFTMGSQPNDGRVIQILSRGGPSADRMTAVLYLLALDSQGLQPKSWPAGEAGKLDLAPGDHAYLVSVLGLRYHLACVGEDAAQIGAVLEEGLAQSGRMPPDAKRAFFISAAAFQGFYRGNAVMAQTWVESAKALRGSAQPKDWDSAGAAAVAYAQGRTSEAVSALRRYIALLERLPRSGMLIAERERTERLIQKLSSESACA